MAISNLTDEIASVALLPRNDILRFSHLDIRISILFCASNFVFRAYHSFVFNASDFIVIVSGLL